MSFKDWLLARDIDNQMGGAYLMAAVRMLGTFLALLAAITAIIQILTN